ncbi:MAG: hypothetical protein IJ934_07570 [Acetobacter sp.]|nr:hypothetical protein [Acetobacter sp.]
MVSKKDQRTQEIAKLVGAGKEIALETVDFADPNRPLTCLEVDFPILPVNEIASIEAASSVSKPVYQMSKWWARRCSSVFRTLLLAAAAKAPEDHTHAAHHVWAHYYANHAKKGAFSHLKVADIFMGGGTTLLEGARLGMSMFGNDINPVAYFVVQQELADINIKDVQNLLADVETAVKPHIMPYYSCDGPNGEKGIWTHVPTQKTMPPDFDPLSIPWEERPHYHYEGPEQIYTFWGKHAPCPATGCGHRTPLIKSPLIAYKTLSLAFYPHRCEHCGNAFDIEPHEARIASDVPFVLAPDHKPFAVLLANGQVTCPRCRTTGIVKLGKKETKKVTFSLLLREFWLKGCPDKTPDGTPYGGAAQDMPDATGAWINARAAQDNAQNNDQINSPFIEVRGDLPPFLHLEILDNTKTNPETKPQNTALTGIIPKNGFFICAACGGEYKVLEAIKTSQKTAPMAAYAVQGYAPLRKKEGKAYNGRFFAPFTQQHAAQYNAACAEWEARKNTDLKDYYPLSEIPYGVRPHLMDNLPSFGFTHWWMMFNPRQLLVHAQLLKAITTVGNYAPEVRNYVLGAFQQYLRNQCLFTIWNIQNDILEPQFANNNFASKNTPVENCVFHTFGRGNWTTCSQKIIEGRLYTRNPWELFSKAYFARKDPEKAASIQGKSEKIYPQDPLPPYRAVLRCLSSTDLKDYEPQSLDLVITDPPFGDLLFYADLSDFFYVWLRLAFQTPALKNTPNAPYFEAPYTPKALEVVANRARNPDDPNGFYQRLLTQCWKEAHRTLKDGGLLAFVFHHSADKPWVAVLESLFEAGFYLVATYPVRSDQMGVAFGSKSIEYDIIHVCRKRLETPKKVSWAKMRREVMSDVRHLETLLTNHEKEGLSQADSQVIRRGKALEYYSKHYGQVYIDEERVLSVEEALVGINQIIDEDVTDEKNPLPNRIEPHTRLFLRIFKGETEIKRDHMQKLLRGTGVTPQEFIKRGWCTQAKGEKIFAQVDPLEFAKAWHGKHKCKLISDLDQALVLIGACYNNSGMNAKETLTNANFKPHQALGALLGWLSQQSVDPLTQAAAKRASSIYNVWKTHKDAQEAALEKDKAQGSLFEDP